MEKGEEEEEKNGNVERAEDVDFEYLNKGQIIREMGRGRKMREETKGEQYKRMKMRSVVISLT